METPEQCVKFFQVNNEDTRILDLMFQLLTLNSKCLLGNYKEET